MAIAPSSAVTLAGADQAVRAAISAAQKSGHWVGGFQMGVILQHLGILETSVASRFIYYSCAANILERHLPIVFLLG